MTAFIIRHKYTSFLKKKLFLMGRPRQRESGTVEGKKISPPQKLICGGLIKSFVLCIHQIVVSFEHYAEVFTRYRGA